MQPLGLRRDFFVCLGQPTNNVYAFLFAFLRAIFGTTLFTILHTSCVQCATNDVVSHTREILNASATNEHQRVFLQVVPFARNVRSHFHAVAQPNTGYFPKRRVWLLWCGRIHTHAYTALLRTRVQSWGGCFVFLPDTPGTHKLIYRRHSPCSLLCWFSPLPVEHFVFVLHHPHAGRQEYK